MFPAVCWASHGRDTFQKGRPRRLHSNSVTQWCLHSGCSTTRRCAVLKAQRNNNSWSRKPRKPNFACMGSLSDLNILNSYKSATVHQLKAPVIEAPSPRTVAKGVQDQSAAPAPFTNCIGKIQTNLPMGHCVISEILGTPPGCRALNTAARSRRKSCV